MPDREDMPRIVGIVLSRSPRIILRTGWRYLKAKKQAQRAERLFRQRLEGQGLGPEAVDRLTEMYISNISLRVIMKDLALPAIRRRGDSGRED